MATIENPQTDASRETPTATLLRLLPEFTALARQTVVEADIRRTRREFYKVIFSLGIALISVAATIPVFEGPFFRTPSTYTTDVHYEVVKWIVGIAMFFLLIVGLASLNLQQARARISTFAVGNSATQLKGLVRTASQILEYGEADFSQRLELNLRIAEAENVLLYASHYLRPKMSSDETEAGKTDLSLELPVRRIKGL